MAEHQQSEEVDQNAPEFEFQGVLEGHSGWVTSIVAGFSQKENEDSPILVSGSRDKTLIYWKLYDQNQEGLYGQPFRQLTGHNHFVTDLALSQENCFVISSSWDKTLRLWDLRTGKTTRLFQGHTKEVFAVAFSPDNRQIISAGADKKIYLWNTLADLKYKSGPEQEFDKDTINHTDWVAQLKYSPQAKTTGKAPAIPQYFASVGWDGKLKIWNTNMQIKNSFKAHEGNVNSVSISPNGKYIATGGRDKKLKIWEVTDLSAFSREFQAGSIINQISFNPKLQWVAAGTEDGIKIWDLMSVNTKPITTLNPKSEKEGGKIPQCTSLCWNALGKKLFAGFTDGKIYVWHVNSQSQ